MAHQSATFREGEGEEGRERRKEGERRWEREAKKKNQNQPNSSVCAFPTP